MDESKEVEELAKDIRIEIADIYQEEKDMGSAEFTTRYNQDCLKILVADKLAKEGYRKHPPVDRELLIKKIKKEIIDTNVNSGDISGDIADFIITYLNGEGK